MGEDINISLEDYLKAFDIDELRPQRIKSKTFINGLIDRILKLLDVDHELTVIIRRVEPQGLVLAGGSQDIQGQGIDEEIEIGKLFNFFFKMKKGEKGGASFEDLVRGGVKYFPLTGYAFKYVDVDGTETEIIKPDDGESITENYLNTEYPQADLYINKYDEDDVAGAKDIKFVANSAKNAELNALRRKKQVEDKLEKNYQMFSPNAIGRMRFAVGWSFPLDIEDGEGIWGFVSFFSKNERIFNSEKHISIIEQINSQLLKFAKFSSDLNLMYKSFEDIAVAKINEDHRRHRYAAKTYESIDYFDKAWENYLLDSEQIQRNFDDWFINKIYIDDLFSALYCKASSATGYSEIKNFDFISKTSSELAVSNEDSPRIGLSETIMNFFSRFESEYMPTEPKALESYDFIVFNFEKTIQRLASIGRIALADNMYLFYKKFETRCLIKQFKAARIGGKISASLKYFWLSWWGNTTKYGTSPARVLSCALIFWLVFGAWYAYLATPLELSEEQWTKSENLYANEFFVRTSEVAKQGEHVEIVQLKYHPFTDIESSFLETRLIWGLSFSATVMTTLGFGDIVPKSRFALLVVGLNLVIGYFLLGALIIVVLRRVMPRF